ncbi:type II toxin-antitoxin system VapC family toxin [Aquisphaera insulae]|uniref:type II toxin-antitoxin system VapC family toxin n=1 Tax=Aquisphaera insulae TaxID=2712864 RepID=UPI00210F31ED|nr:PIN domain-containing protein [Aquisphaera insulae]
MTDCVLLDTGPMVAIFSKDDAYHERCVSALASLPAPLPTCWPVVVEAAWLLRTRPASLHQMIDGFKKGLFALLSLDADDLVAVAEIMRRYQDAGLQLADAALVHLAEREGVRTVFTTDRRDFSIVRLKHKRRLTLIPDNQ